MKQFNIVEQGQWYVMDSEGVRRGIRVDARKNPETGMREPKKGTKEVRPVGDYLDYYPEGAWESREWFRKRGHL